MDNVKKTATENIRAVSLELLLEILEKGAFSNQLLRAVSEKYAYLPKQERSFLMRLTKGTVERCIELDYLIDSVSKTKVAKMKPPVRNILRMGVYQLKYMDSVPDSAACNEAVRLAVKKGFGGLKGFVNGVMRSLARSLPDIAYPDREKDFAAWLSVTCSLPEWLAGQWLCDYGMERTEQMAAAFLADQPLAVRANTVKNSTEELAKRLQKRGIGTKIQQECLYLTGVDQMEELPEFVQGLFYIQDKSSQAIAPLLAPKASEHVLDVCAAPGGKALHAAELMYVDGTRIENSGISCKEDGLVLACDLTPQKVALIEENIVRMGMQNIKTRCLDATVYEEGLEGWADVLIADLPCSGLGVIGRKAEIKYRVTKQDCQELAALQRQILDTVWRYVKPGGRMVYSTCTVSKVENEQNVEWFLNEHPEFSLTGSEQYFPQAGVQDGFFYALLTRNGKTGEGVPDERH